MYLKEEPDAFYSLSCVCCSCVLYSSAISIIIYSAYYIYIVPNLSCFNI